MHPPEDRNRGSRLPSDYETPPAKRDASALKETRMRSEPKERQASTDRHQQSPPEPQQPHPRIVHLKLEASTVVESSPNVGAASRKVLLSELSNHLLESFTLEISNGRANATSASFAHFHKTKSLQWDPIQHAIRQLERFGSRYSIPHFTVKYPELMGLCRLKAPSHCAIAASIAEREAILRQYPIVGREYLGPDAPVLAATRIQAHWRMVRQRIRFTKMRILVERVRIIQRFWKRKYVRIVAQNRIREASLIKLKSFETLSQTFMESYPAVKTKHRVEIHLHNISLDELAKLSISELQQKHNTALSRVFRASADLLVDVIYVSPLELPQEVQSYYYRMLAMTGVGRDRVHFLSPEKASRFPSTLSTAKLVLYSSGCQNRIRRLVGNRPAYIVSGMPSTDDVQLSVELNVPLLSGSPFKHRYYSTKAGARSLFRKLHMPLPKGGFDIYNLEELVNTLAILIYTNPAVPRWFLKVDDEVEGRGIAILNVAAFATIKTFARALGKRSVIETEFTETEVIKAIAEELAAGIYTKLKVCEPRVYPSAKAYLAAYLVKGGSIESSAESSTALSINFLIEPTGEHTILSCHQKVTHNTRTIGCICPAQAAGISFEHIVKSMKRVLWDEEQMYGYFTIDVLLQKAGTEDQMLAFIGMDCYLNTLAAAVTFAEVITHSKYDVEANALAVLKKTKEADFAKYETGSNYSMVSAPPPAAGESPVLVYFPLVSHEALKSSNLKSFFSACRFGNVSFDTAKREGAVFQFMDGLASGVLGLAVVAPGLGNALKYAAAALEFLAREFGGLLEAAEQGKDRVDLAVVKSKVLVMARRDKKSRKEAAEPANISFLF